MLGGGGGLGTLQGFVPQQQGVLSLSHADRQFIQDMVESFTSRYQM